MDTLVTKHESTLLPSASRKTSTLLIAKGDRNEGLDIYLDLEKNAVDQSFRDIATILFVINSIDFEPEEELLDKLGPLKNSLIWKSSALELTAFIYLKNDKKKEALETFEEIKMLPNKPASLGLRAQNMIDFLKKE